MKYQVILSALISFAIAQEASPKEANPKESSAKETSVKETKPSEAAKTAVVSAQQQCMQEKKCAGDDVACQASCAQVPNPTADQVNETTRCIAACHDSTEVFLECQNKCMPGFLEHNVRPPVESKDTDKDGSASKSSNNKTLNGTNVKTDGSGSSDAMYGSTYSYVTFFAGLALFGSL